MDYQTLISSGTDDDLPLSYHTRISKCGERGSSGHMEAKIHSLEQRAYDAVLSAFQAQSDAISWEKERLMAELRKELRVSDDQHRELLSKYKADDTIHQIRFGYYHSTFFLFCKYMRHDTSPFSINMMVPNILMEWRQTGGNQVTLNTTRKKQRVSASVQHLSSYASAKPISYPLGLDNRLLGNPFVELDPHSGRMRLPEGICVYEAMPPEDTVGRRSIFNIE